MTKIGRNDPCPCGSGKKFKTCCLAKAEAADQQPKQPKEHSFIPRLLNWLAEHHGLEVGKAVYSCFFGGVNDEQLDALQKLDSGYQQMININMGEWTVGDACITVKRKRTPVRDVLLGIGGPLLTAQDRERLQATVENPMSLFEIRRVEPGVGVEVADLLRPKEPLVWVQEKAGSQSLVPWDTVGGRLMRENDIWMFSGAIYPMPRNMARPCLEAIKRELAGAKWNSNPYREVVSAIIISCWLRHLLAEQPLPELVDAASGEKFLLVTDYYRVTDWAALSAALEAQPDVFGDRENGWIRYEVLEDNTKRTRAAVNVEGPDSVELFCRTLNSANEARSWLEGIAGGALKYRTREVVTPRSRKAMASAPKPRRPVMPPEEEAQMVREMLMQHYQTWPDIGLPALGGKTPRKAVTTAKGRKAVVELLKEFEQMEVRKAKHEGGTPFDFGFLWDELGLSKERNT